MFDRYVVIFGFFSCCSGLAFLAKATGYFELVPVPVARVENVDGTVRRLPFQDLTWFRVNDGALFGEGDTVSTGESARTKLVIFGVGELELGPGSMVVLGGTQDALELNFVSGSAKLRKAKSTEKKVSVTRDLASTQRGGREQGSAQKVAAIDIATQVKAKGDKGVAQVELAQAELSALTVIEDEGVSVEAAPTKDEAKKIFANAPSTLTLEGQTVKSATGTVVNGNPSLRMNKPGTMQAQSELAALNLEGTAITAKKGEEVAVLDMGGKVLSVERKVAIPELRFPLNGEKLVLGKGQEPSLRWESVVPDKEKGDYEQPKTYYLFIQKMGSSDKPRQVETDQPFLAAAKFARRSGEYRWWVRAKSESGKVSARSEVRRVKLEVHANIKKPTILPVKVE